MIKNYLISTIRFLRRNKLFAGINILGLSLALAASFIILLFVINELSYNTCYKNRKQIYRVLGYNTEVKIISDGTPYVLSQSIKNEFHQAKYVAATKNMGKLNIKLNEEFIPINHVIGTNSELFKIFDLTIDGQQENILDEPNSIVISQKQARKFFSDDNPIGKELVVLLNEKEEVFIVKGVFNDIPVNSTLQADFFINSKWPLERLNMRNKDKNAETNWYSFDWDIWLLLNKNSDIAQLNQHFRALEKKVYGEKDRHDFSIQNLSDVYFDSQEIYSGFKKGNLKSIRIFSAISILIIIVAAFNYIILSTAVSTGRAKEIGVRKTNGASSQSIRKQMLNESVVLILLVLPIALLLAFLGKPYAEELFQTKLLVIKSNIIIYVLIYLALTISIGLTSGLYTSSLLSRLNVMIILKNPIQTGKRKSRVRFALIVVQLVIFCIFVSSTLIINSQYNYALNENPGYYNKDILFINMRRNSESSSAFMNNIKAYPNVISVGGAIDALPMTSYWPYPMELPNDKSKKVPIELLAIDYNFIEAMGIEVVEGRSFSREIDGNKDDIYVLNEKAVKALELTNPIGKKIDVVNGTVIGVVKDFNLHSFHSDIPPLLIVASDNYATQVAIHYKAGTLKKLLPLIKSEWAKIAPNLPFNYKTIDELKKEIYSEERNLSVIVSISSIFSLLIATLGLFGLTLFVMKTQTKEIGLKRVFGSSQKGIVFSFIRKNFTMVIIATIFSTPISIFIMNIWLRGFSYKTNIEWWIFAVTFFLATLMVLAIVYFHSYRASRVNPIEAIRYE